MERKFLTDYWHKVEFLGKEAYISSVVWGEHYGYGTFPGQVTLKVKNGIDGEEYAEVTLKKFNRDWIKEV